MTRHCRAGRLVTLACVLLVAASAAQATIVLMPGNHPQPDEQIILFDAATTGTTIAGEIDSTGVAIQFQSLTDQTLQGAQGAASITEEGGGALTSVALTVPGGLFGDFIFNVTNVTGSLTIAGSDNFGNPFSFPDLAGGNGNNFFTLVGAAGESLSQLSVTATTGGFDTFQGARISSVCQFHGETCVPISTVPEPATLALLGLGLAGVGFARGRSRRIPLAP